MVYSNQVHSTFLTLTYISPTSLHARCPKKGYESDQHDFVQYNQLTEQIHTVIAQGY